MRYCWEPSIQAMQLPAYSANATETASLACVDFTLHLSQCYQMGERQTFFCGCWWERKFFFNTKEAQHSSVDHQRQLWPLSVSDARSTYICRARRRKR
jgi:hypothetical protein